MNLRPLLEIAVGTPEEAVRAVEAGADRLELSSGLELGGLTPSLGLFRAVRDAVRVPVWVLLRPRSGNFCYYAREFSAMRADSELFFAEGAAGIVFGVIDGHGEIDRERCRALVEVARGRAVFHRGFDFLPDSVAALDELVQLGFVRVLTSGGAGTTQADAARLAELVKHAAGRIEVLAAGGVRPHNVAELVRRSGCRQVHSSARGAAVPFTSETNPQLAAAMGTSGATSGEVVRSLRTELDRVADTLS